MASTRPGTPPPVPRSANVLGGPASSDGRFGEAQRVGEVPLEIPGPEETLGLGAREDVEEVRLLLHWRTGSGRADHHAPTRLLALGAGLDTIDVGDGVVHHLAVG